MADDAVRPTKERHRHDIVAVPDINRQNQIPRPARIETQTVLDRYARRKTLDENQIAAGTKYTSHYILSRRHGCKLMSFQGRVSGGKSDASDMAVAAGIARDKAMAFLDGVGRDFRSITEWVCCDDRAAEAWAVTAGLHPMRGIKTLRQALDALAKHYGIAR
jgi:hypothetical protein